MKDLNLLSRGDLIIIAKDKMCNIGVFLDLKDGHHAGIVRYINLGSWWEERKKKEFSDEELKVKIQSPSSAYSNSALGDSVIKNRVWKITRDQLSVSQLCNYNRVVDKLDVN